MKTKTFTIAGTECSPEMTLLLLCSVNEPCETEFREIQSLIQDRPDWDLFYRLILKHRVFPVVYKNLKRAGSNEINSEFMSALEKRVSQNQIKSLQYAAELIRLLELLKKQGVRAFSIKGPILSFMTCGDISMRMSRDLDIMVCPAELEKAEQVLIKEGYLRDGGVANLTPRQLSALLRKQHHFSYINRKKGILIELHWRFCDESYMASFEELWASKAEVDLNGSRVYVLNPEETFLYLVFHGSRHAWFRIKWLCDIVDLLKKGNLEWNRIYEKAEKRGIVHLLGQTLILANLLFKTDPHKEMFEKRAYRSASRLARLALPFIFSTDEQPRGSNQQYYLLEKYYVFVWNTGAVRKLTNIRWYFYPDETDFARIKLPDRRFAVYYFLHLLFKLQSKCRLLRKAG